jgi:tRNA (mo5U34)-methyltransferase|tara:strand:- start:4698 stop:5675 length:978 start_codon:yes stop_codon:yes gene_type:complete
VIEFGSFFRTIASNPLRDCAEPLRKSLQRNYSAKLHGDFPVWMTHLQQLPRAMPSSRQLDGDVIRIGKADDLLHSTQEQLSDTLLKFKPWRKGPFSLFDILIDTEWQSNLKWERLLPHIRPLTDCMVLDIGCGNGYHCWRMRGAGAAFVLGVDPGQLNLVQFEVFKQYLPDEPVFLLPLTGEQLPRNFSLFDSVYSMGVLHHSRSPLKHLELLRNCLKPGGELVLESLVVEGDSSTTLVPEDRYARMRNVWFIPSTPALERWLTRVGFTEVRTVAVSQTGTDEQRATRWMDFQSLADSLQPGNPDVTVEGLPAPRRAILVAHRPS